MKKQITITILGILMLAGSMAMYSGESISFQTNLTNSVYTVTGNTSSLEGLNVIFKDGNITISTVLNYKPDNFTIIFFDNLTREVVKTIHSRSKSTKIKYVDKYVDRNVIVYIPEYINTTKMVEVEKIMDNTDVKKEESRDWIGYVAFILGAILIIISIKMQKSIKHKEVKS